MNPIQALLDENWEELLQTVGVGPIDARVVPALHYAVKYDPIGGLKLADQVNYIYEEYANEQECFTYYNLVIRLLAGDRIATPASIPSFEETLELVVSVSDDETERMQVLQHVMGVILGLNDQSRESEAYDLLRSLVRTLPRLTNRFTASFNLLGAQLQIGIVVNALESNEIDEAVRSYYLALRLLLSLKLHRLSREILWRIADIFGRSSPRAVQTLCELMREEEPGMEDVLGDDGYEALAALTSAATLALRNRGSIDAWFSVLRLAKGRSFANSVLQTKRYMWIMDRKAQELFFRFLKLEESAGEAILTEESNLFEEILASYSSKIIPEAGNNKVEQRDNIARALDEHVRRRVASLSRLRTERYTVADVRREIPEDAVLIDIYRPRFQEELNPVFCLLLTREEGRLFIIEGAGRGIGWTEFEGETSVHRVGVDGVVIAGLRSALQEGTEGGKPLTDEAQHLLQVCFRTYFGYAVEYLDTLYSRGKRHLIIIPSGPLHFLPFHLLGMSGLPLAERWIVSYLPTIDLLRRPAYSGETRSGAGIYAISYREPWAKQRGHTPLENSLNEANTIAHTLGVRAKTDEDVTRATVREGLRTSRFVHLACHGGHNVAAPSLQCLYLTPEYEDDDGRLFCVDILGFDLRGLSLLGLSACETALGRFDAGDNLRGLSAAALTAGASSVIGTLWPTADDTSEVFFTTLYANLMAGETRLGAYRKAQVKTRRLFPEYWDWGAFYLSGLW